VQVAGDGADPAGLAGYSRVLGWPAACLPSCCFYFSFFLLCRGRERSLQEDNVSGAGCRRLISGFLLMSSLCPLVLRNACGEALK